MTSAIFIRIMLKVRILLEEEWGKKRKINEKRSAISDFSILRTKQRRNWGEERKKY